MKKFLTILVALLLCVSTAFTLLNCSSNSNNPIDTPANVPGTETASSYLTPLSANNVADTWTNKLEEGRASTIISEEDAKANGLKIDTTPAGYKTNYEKVDLQMSMDDLTMWGNDPLIWPGNLLKINEPTNKNVFQQIVGLPRAPLTLSTSLEGSTGTGKKSTVVNSTQSSAREGISLLVSENLVSGAQLPYMIATQMTEIKSEKELSIAIGANIKGGFGAFGASLSAALNINSGQSMTYAVILIRQMYFTISVDYPVDKGPAGFFDDNVTLDQIKTAIKTGDVPAYVSSVTYGRLAAITIRTNYSFDQLQAKLNVKANYGTFVSGEVNTEIMESSSDQGMDINYFIYGGSIEGNQDVMTSKTQAEMMAALNSPYDPLKNVGVPISYTVSHLGDGSLAKVGSSGSYYVKSLTPIPVNSVSFDSNEKAAMNNLYIGNSYNLQATRNPSTAVLYPVTYTIAGAKVIDSSDTSYKSELCDENGNLIASLTMGNDTGGLWMLKLSDNVKSIGKDFTIAAHAGNKSSEPFRIILKTPQYNVTFKYTDPSNTASFVRQSKQDGLVAEPDGAPDVEGKKFAGWYTEKECITPFDFNSIVTKEITLYGKYSFINEICMVTFKGYTQLSSGVLQDRIASFEKGKVISIEAPKRENFVFSGWYKDANCTKPWYESDIVGASDTLTLYSKWDGIPVKSVTISVPYTSFLGLKLYSKHQDLVPRETLQFNSAVEPLNAANKNVTFSLANQSDSSYVSITASGLLTVKDFTIYNGGSIGIIATADGVSSSVFYVTLLKGWTFIYNAEGIYNIRYNLSGKFMLMNNVNISSSYSSWTPIGQSYWSENSTFTSYFSGTFDGKGYTITYDINVSYNGSGYYSYGLFGTAQYATFKNVNVRSTIQTVGTLGSKNVVYTGGIVGAAKSCTFESCTTNGSISMKYDSNTGTVVGGISGISANSSYSYCTNNAVLYAKSGSIAACGKITGISEAKSSTFNSCTYNGSVTASSTIFTIFVPFQFTGNNYALS